MTVDAATQEQTSPTEAAETATGGDDAAEQTAGTNEAPQEASTSPEQSTDGEQPQSESGQDTEQEAKPKRKPRKQSTAKKTRSVELTLTVTGTADGEWQADLMHGSSRVVRGLTIPATAVSRAAKELHADISGAIEHVLEAAREQHRSRVEELQAELEKAQQALAELEE